MSGTSARELHFQPSQKIVAIIMMVCVLSLFNETNARAPSSIVPEMEARIMTELPPHEAFVPKAQDGSRTHDHR